MPYNNNYQNNYNNGGSRGNYNGNRSFSKGNYNNNSRQYSNNNPTNSSNNAQSNNDDTQTPALRLINETAGKFLNVYYWNRCVTAEIGSFQPGSQFDYTMIRNSAKISQCMSFTTIHELLAICEDVLTSIKETGTFTPVAIENGKKDSIVEISNGSNIGRGPGIYLVIYKQVDSGRRTNNMDLYPFGSTKVILNYDHNSGNGKEDIRPSGDFKKFVFILKEAAKAFTMAQAHAISELKKTEKMATYFGLSAIASALNVDLDAQLKEKLKTNQRRSGNTSSGSAGKQSGYVGNGRFNANGGGQSSNPPSLPSPALNPTFNSQPTLLTSQAADDPVDITINPNTLANVDFSQFG